MDILQRKTTPPRINKSATSTSVRQFKVHFILISLIVILWNTIFAGTAPSDGVRLVVNEQPLFVVPFLIGNTALSSDCRHVQYSVGRGNKTRVGLDGVESDSYDTVRDLSFSPDATRTAYVARRNTKFFLVVDGIEQPEFSNIIQGVFETTAGRLRVSGGEDIQRSSLLFSPNSKRMLYFAVRDGRIFAVCDGKDGPPLDEIAGFGGIFSADSKRLAYSGTRDGIDRLIVDGTDQPITGRVGALAFSPDSTRLVHAVARGTKWIMVVDGKEGPPLDVLDKGMLFCSNSEHFAYSGDRGGKGVVVLDGRVTAEFDSITNQTLQFSPDSERFAYIVSKHGSQSVVIDGKGDGEFSGVVWDLEFSPNSRRVLYIVVEGENRSLILDGKRVAASGSVLSAVFSPDSRRVAYLDQTTGAYRVVVDDFRSPPYECVGLNEQHLSPGIVKGHFIFFTPDSRHFVYAALRRGKWVMVVDGKEGAEYDRINFNSLFLSPSGAHVAYSAGRGGENFSVLDNVERKTYPASAFRFVSDERIEGLALRLNSRFEDEWIRVTINILPND